MTGQMVVEFNGRDIPEVIFKGDILPINVRMLDRFIRKAYRVRCYELSKASEKAKQKPAPVEVLKPDAVIGAAKVANKINLNKSRGLPLMNGKISEDKKNEEVRNVGDAKGPGRSESPEKAKLGGAR